MRLSLLSTDQRVCFFLNPWPFEDRGDFVSCMIHPDVGTLAILFSLFRFNNSTCTCTKKIGRDKTNPFSIASYTLCVIVPLATVVIAGTAIVVILLRKPKLSAQLQRLVPSLGVN